MLLHLLQDDTFFVFDESLYGSLVVVFVIALVFLGVGLMFPFLRKLTQNKKRRRHRHRESKTQSPNDRTSYEDHPDE